VAISAKQCGSEELTLICVVVLRVRVEPSQQEGLPDPGSSRMGNLLRKGTQAMILLESTSIIDLGLPNLTTYREWRLIIVIVIMHTRSSKRKSKANSTAVTVPAKNKVSKPKVGTVSIESAQECQPTIGDDASRRFFEHGCHHKQAGRYARAV
jgi:hypothetical protein